MRDLTRATSRPRVLLVTPIAPAQTGNGLAMRAGLLVEGLRRCAELVVAVVPVADPLVDEAALRWAAERSTQALLAPLPSGTDAVRGWLACSQGRELASRCEPLPARARRAPPELGRQILRRAGGAFDAVYVLRSYLAGVAAPFLEQSPRPRLVLDLDEDDEVTLDSIAALHRLRGETSAAEGAESEARACGRLLGSCLSWFDRVLVASDRERGEMQARCDSRRVSVLPNAVRVGRPSAQALSDQARSDQVGSRRAGAVVLVFVGNLDYAPNRDAVERLVRGVLPAVRRRLPEAELHLVGAGSGLSPSDGVIVHGAVPDLGAVYRRATLTVVPLRAGGGSRLKILEAFAERVPVVATLEAVRGLDVRAGEQFLVGSSSGSLAEAAVRIAESPALAEALVQSGLSFVSRHHDLGAVANALASLCLDDLG